MADEEFDLIVQNEDGTTNRASVKRQDMKTVNNLRAALAAHNMTQAKEFNIGYEHPQFAVFTVVRRPSNYFFQVCSRLQVLSIMFILNNKLRWEV